ncbi:MAG: adenylate/guanylate cyclase domain-containing protein [Rhizobium sp.]|nr:adenylate/guanylate cyclase domain-containing protein [Rhizobium sp.]
MIIPRANVSESLIERVSLWLQQSALRGSDLESLVHGLCERLAAAGVPLLRVHLSFSMLHPLYDALGFTWVRGQGVEIEGFRPDGSEADKTRFVSSPYYYLLANGLPHLRRRIDALAPSEFAIFDDLKAMNGTDYLAFVQSFDEETTRGMVGSWTTDAPGGFSEEVIDALLHIQSHLAVAAKMAVLGKLADNMVTTYLGGNAGQRVLSGQVRRGDGETIRAALVMADMRRSTALAEKAGRQVYIDTLNTFFDAIAAPFNRNGGEILSFMGDGFLAVYPCDRHRGPSEVATQAAMAAVREATARMADLNAGRRSERLGEVKYGIALHVGNVMFGNVGLQDRLTFSAFGGAVNEVHRLQGLTKTLGRPVIASQAFATYCGGDWLPLGERRLRGVQEKLSLFAPGEGNMTASPMESTQKKGLDLRSEAEHVMLLYRNSRQQKPAGPGANFLQ